MTAQNSPITKKAVKDWLDRVAKALKSIADEAEAGTGTIGLKDLLFYLALYGYFAGFTYSFYYYRTFDIPLAAADIPVYAFFIYSYNVVEAYWLVMLVIGVVIWAATTFAIPRLPSSAQSLASALMVLSPFPCLVWLAAGTAERHAQLLRSGRTANVVSVAWKDEATAKLPQGLVTANQNEGVLLISETSDYLFVLVQPEAEAGELPIGSVYRLRKEDTWLATTKIPNQRLR